MATRNSPYGSFLNQIPSWVTGGDYGDITGLLNQREASFQNLAQERQNTLNNEIALQEKQQAQNLDNTLADIWASDQRPSTLKDMYGVLVNAGADTKNPLVSIDAMSKLSALEEDAQKKKLIDLKEAVNLAPYLDYAKLNQVFPGALSPAEAAIAQQEGRRRVAGQKSAEDPLNKNVVFMLDGEGTPTAIPRALYNVAIKNGYIDPDRSSPAAVAQAQAKAAAKLQPQSDAGPGVIDSVLGFFGGSKPGEAEAKKQKALVDNLPKDTTLVGWRNKKTGQTQYLPQGQTPK